MKANQTLDPIGTICFLPNDNLKEIIPTLRETASILDGTWKILIVSVESSNSQMSFKEIKRYCRDFSLIDNLIIKKGVEFQKVVPFAFKVLSAINFVKTPYISFFSSYQKPHFKCLADLANVLLDNPSVGAINAEVSVLGQKKQCNDRARCQFFDNEQGIKEFGLRRFGVYGTLYNIPILNKNSILERFEHALRAHVHYPGIYLNIMLAANCKTAVTSNVISEENIDRRNCGKISDYFTKHSYGQRCDQLIALRNALFESFMDLQKRLKLKDFPIKNFYYSYVQLSTVLLNKMIRENEKIYGEQMMGIEITAKSFGIFCIGAVEQFPDYTSFQEDLKKSIFYKIDNIIKDAREIDKEWNAGLENNELSFFSSR